MSDLDVGRSFLKSIRLHPRTRMPWRDPRRAVGVWTPRQTFIWRSGTFTVPGDVSEERVQFSADRYMRKFGEGLEREGFRVLFMGRPELNRSVVAQGMTDADRRPYIMWAKVTRRPVEITVDVPDEDIAIYERAGYRHK